MELNYTRGKIVFPFYAASGIEANESGWLGGVRGLLQDLKIFSVPPCLCGEVRVLCMTRKVTLEVEFTGELAGSIPARECQRGHIVMLRSHVHEVLHPLQDAMRKIFGRRRSRLQDTPDSVQPKFRVLRLRFNYAA